MARNITLLALRTGIRSRGGWVNSRRVTDAFLNDVINSAITEVYNLLVDKWADYYSTETNLSTSIGVDSVALPTTFYKLRKLELRWSQNPDRWVRLRPHDLESSHVYQESSGRTFRYRIQAQNLRFAPTPQAVETLRITFIPAQIALSTDGAVFDGINGYEELVMQTAVMRIKHEMDLDATNTANEVTRLTAQIRTAADGRDATEPFFLDPRGPRLEEDDEDGVWLS